MLLTSFRTISIFGKTAISFETRYCTLNYLSFRNINIFNRKKNLTRIPGQFGIIHIKGDLNTMNL